MPPGHPLAPRYCETPLIDIGFPLEPWNAVSSGMIVLVGLAMLWLVASRARNVWLFWLMAGLVVVNGVGSILWHGLRTRWALNLDVLPAIVFVVLLAFLWARRVLPLWQALLAVGVLLAVPLAGAAARAAGLEMPAALRPLLFSLPILVIVVLALALIWRTASLSRRAMASGIAALALAGIAFAARSLDPLSCGVVAMGSHFLWHMFLSSAAFMGLVTLVQLRESGGPQGRPA